MGGEMQGFSLWHWIIYFLIAFVLVGIPSWRILRKAGFNGAWSLLAGVPLANLVALWVFAFVKWPNEK